MYIRDKEGPVIKKSSKAINKNKGLNNRAFGQASQQLSEIGKRFKDVIKTKDKGIRKAKKKAEEPLLLSG